MKICFVLPRTNSKAIGGYKIVYEYANRLSRDNEITILYLNTNYLKKYKVPRFVKKTYFDILTLMEPRWFKLDKRVKQVSDYSLKSCSNLFNATDVVVATAVNTAEFVMKRFKTPNKLYLIQGRETWAEDAEIVDDTYSLGLKNIVVSEWLKRFVDKRAPHNTYLIPNPIDLNIYRPVNPIERRKKTIACLYNSNPVKGFKQAHEVILHLKQKYPDMNCIIFGAENRPENLPKWIKYIKNASQEKTVEIYNTASVFLCSSIEEGFGLTGLESMACGCALCSTDYDAVHEYAVDGVNSLLSPIFDIDAQVNNVSKLFDDEDLRVEIARKAIESASRFSWEEAMQILLEVMQY